MGFLMVKAWGKPAWGWHQENARFSGAPGDGAPSMAARLAEEGEALQQARCTTTSTEDALVRPWTCAATRLLTSVRVASCHRLGHMTHISFAQRKSKKISQ